MPTVGAYFNYSLRNTRSEGAGLVIFHLSLKVLKAHGVIIKLVYGADVCLLLKLDSLALVITSLFKRFITREKPRDPCHNKSK